MCCGQKLKPGGCCDEACQVCLCAKYFEVPHLKQGYNIHNAILKGTEMIQCSQVESNSNSDNAWECLSFRINFVCK